MRDKRASSGNPALMLVCASLRHVTATQREFKRDLNMKHLVRIEINKPKSIAL